MSKMNRISYTDFGELLLKRDYPGIMYALENRGANVYLNSAYRDNINWKYYDMNNLSHNIPLTFAIGDLDLMKLMLDMGADPNLDFSSGTPLMRACNDYNLEAVTFLLENGAKTSETEIDPDETTPGYTSMQIALMNDSPEIVEVLLKHKAKVFPNDLSYVESVEVLNKIIGVIEIDKYSVYNALNEYVRVQNEELYEALINKIDPSIREDACRLRQR